MYLKPNSSAPNFSLQTVEGEQITLNEVLKSGKHVLLVFLRRLG
jgi:peroxiredoxin